MPRDGYLFLFLKYHSIFAGPCDSSLLHMISYRDKTSQTQCTSMHHGPEVDIHWDNYIKDIDVHQYNTWLYKAFETRIPHLPGQGLHEPQEAPWARHGGPVATGPELSRHAGCLSCPGGSTQ